MLNLRQAQQKPKKQITRIQFPNGRSREGALPLPRSLRQGGDFDFLSRVGIQFQTLVIPTGAGAPATAQWRNLMFP